MNFASLFCGSRDNHTYFWSSCLSDYFVVQNGFISNSLSRHTHTTLHINSSYFKSHLKANLGLTITYISTFPIHSGFLKCLI